MRLKRQVGRWLIIALCAAASVTLPAMFWVPIAGRYLDPILGLFGPLGGLFTS